MCITNPSESGKSGQFYPCQRYQELWNKYVDLDRKYADLLHEVEGDRVREEWEFANEIPDGGNS